jgi:hypothetical protein
LTVGAITTAVGIGAALSQTLSGRPRKSARYGRFSGFQLKIIQEVVTLVVFMGFAVLVLKEKLAWNYLVAFVFLGVAACFAFAFKAPGVGN